MSKTSERPTVLMPTVEEDKAITAAARSDPDAQPLTPRQLKSMPAAPANIDAYIAAAPAEVQPVLQAIRATIRQAAPLAQERISYRMPAFFQGKKALVYFGAFKQHIGLYPPVRQPSLLAQVARYAGPKGNLQFPLSEPMPHALISQIVHARLQEVAAGTPAPRARKPRH